MYVYCGSLFILPNIFVKGNIYTKVDNPNVEKDKISVEEVYNFVETNNIKVYLSDKNEIIDMGLEEYIKGVVCAEMPASYELEALKAQAVAARTYAINKMIEHKQNKDNMHPQADVCDDSTHCQAYIPSNERIENWNSSGLDGLQLWDKIEEAVISTNGQIITYDSQPIKAFFHANSGGKTEDVELVWGGGEIPYLKSVATSGETGYSQYSSSVSVTKEELNNIMKEKYEIFKIDYSKEDAIKIKEVSESQRVQSIKIGNIELSGVDVRKIFGLKSTIFEVKVLENSVEFSVIGYGHGVGMSQTGANELAKNGNNYEQILHHYYTNVDITNME